MAYYVYYAMVGSFMRNCDPNTNFTILIVAIGFEVKIF